MMHALHFTDEHNVPFALPADSVEVTMDLPLPPSTNKRRRIDWRGHDDYKAWKKDAGWHSVCARQFRPALDAHFQQFELTVTLSADCKVDPDNILKQILDFLVSYQIVPDDSPKFARRIIIEWGEAPDGCKLTVRSMHG